MQTRPSLWRLTSTESRFEPPPPPLTYPVLIKCNACVKRARASIHPLAWLVPRRNINTASEQMCPPHCQHTADPDGTKFPPAIFGSPNNSVGNRGVCQGDLPGGVQRERGQTFLPPTAGGTGPERQPQISPNHSNNYQSVDIIYRENVQL